MYNIIGDSNHPRAIIQIIHGMHEYSARYKNFAEFLASKDFLVILSDHKGHGKKALENGTLGKLDEDFSCLVEKQIKITKEFKEKFPNIPLFVLGHSLGSFVAQEHMKTTSSLVEGYLLLGSRGKRKLETFVGKHVMKGVTKIFNNPCNFCNFLLFKQMNYSWLTKDKKAIENYINDPLCNFSYTPKFYFHLLDFIDNLYNKKDFENVNRNLPLFIISGEKDIIGVCGRSVKKLFKFYKNLGFSDIYFKLYKNDRHELLHEADKFKIYEDIYIWINSKLR